MIIFTILALSVIGTTLLTVFTDVCKSWDKAWILILIFIGFVICGIILYLLFLLLLVLFSDPKKTEPKKFYTKTVKRTCEFVTQITRTHVHVKGYENLPKENIFLFVQNHVSDYDPLISIWVFRAYDIIMIMKDSIAKVPMVGKGLKISGFLPIDRNNNRATLKVFIKAINYIKDKKTSVGIYPEGTRSETGELLPFRNGAFKIAEKSHCPIVITTIINSEHIKKRLLYAHTDVYLDIAGTLYYDDYKDLSSVELGDRIHQIMKNSLDAMAPLKIGAKIK